MKKFRGAINSLILGVMTFVVLSLNCIINTVSIGEKEVAKVAVTPYDMLKGGAEEGLMLYKFSVIMMIVFAIVLILFSVVLFLKNIKVIKCEIRLNSINTFFQFALTFFSGLSLIAAFFVMDDVGQIGVGAWLMLAIGVVVSVVNLLFTATQSD